MLRKSFPLILKPIIRPYALNSLKCECNHAASSFSNNEKSVLADPGIIKRENQERFYLQKILTVQQIEKSDEIQNLTSAQDVIKFLQNNKKLIVPLYAPLFLQIYEIMKSNKSEMSAEMFVKNADFENFCKSVNESALALRPSDILCILKTLKFLNISTNCILSQTLLQILPENIDELNINQLIFIEVLIRDAPFSPIVEDLKISLPIVFNTNVQSKLGYGHARWIIDAMCFATSKQAPFKKIDLIAKAALDVREQLTFQQCKDVVNGFLCNNYKVMIGPRKELYLFCMDQVKAKMNENMSFEEISQMTSYIMNNFVESNSFFYDEVFLAKVTKYIVANQLNLIEAGTIMQNLTRIGYVDMDLIDYVDLLLSQTADFKTSTNIITIMAHISSCSDAQYLPPKWDTYEQKIVDYFLNLEVIDIPLARIALELITLNRWHVSLINKAFAEDFLRQYLQQKREKINYLRILNLYQAVKTMGKHNVEVLLSDDIINKAIQYQIESKQKKITAPLETLLGGKSCFVNGILTKYGHYIDHLLVLKKTGQPVPIREEGVKDYQNLQDMVLPANGYVFAIILLPPTCYCIYGELRSKYKLIIDTLAMQGVIPVPISMTIWENLQNAEKLSHLKREIFSRIPGNVRTKAPSIYFEI